MCARLFIFQTESVTFFSAVSFFWLIFHQALEAKHYMHSQSEALSVRLKVTYAEDSQESFALLKSSYL